LAKLALANTESLEQPPKKNPASQLLIALYMSCMSYKENNGMVCDASMTGIEQKLD